MVDRKAIVDGIENIAESYADRFAEVVENAKLLQSVSHVLYYAKDIANNDDGDIEAQNCVKVLESIQVNTAEQISHLIS